MSEYEKNVYMNLFEYPTKHIVELELENEQKDKEIERLKNGYCKLKEKCNNGECDCTNEEYDGIAERNMKLSLEVDRLNNKIKEQNLLLIEFQDMEQKLKLKDNIINELEKYTIENIEVLENRLNSPFYNFEKATKELSIFQNYLDKLKELKESGNNE